MKEETNVKITKNKHKKANKRKIIAIGIVAVALLAYLLYGIFSLIKQPTDTFMVENGKVFLEESAIGYVIRMETVIQGQNYKNGMEQIKTEGEKVPKGEAIFRYYSNGEENLVKKIQDLDIKIQEALSKENTLTTSDIKALEKQIDSKLEELSKTNNLQKIKEYKKDINTAITKKAKMAGELSPAGSYIRQLITERSNLENQLNSGAEYVTAPESGIVSYRVDGLESVLTPDNFSNLSSKMLNDLKLKTGEIVASSSENGKIINNYNCFIATVMTSQNAKDSKVGDTIKIKLSTSAEIPVKIEYKSEESDGSVLLVLKINKSVEELINYRKISFDVVWWNVEGLKIPNSAIVYEGNLAYVVKNRAGYLDKILIKVKKTNENYSLVDNYTIDELKNDVGLTTEDIKNRSTLALYDELIIHPSLDKLK